ncbi:MAG TPA: hypothetical protein VLT60_06515 [Usitatibacter sp.]|nr:hypothetical protein [Usitatibacter sp.]
MKRSLQLFAAAFAIALALPAAAQTLYAVSVRTYSDPGYHGVEGNLYTVDPETAATNLVTSLNVSGKTPVGLDGLAIHPRTGVFYGITAPTSAVIPRSLVILDPATGSVTPVGELSQIGSDIGFDPDGTLFMWLPNTRQLGTVNLDTGEVTARGAPIERGASKGGFAVIGGGKAYVAGTGGAGTLDTVDMNTGEITIGPSLVGAPFADLINGLAYSPRGILYGINTSFGRATQANLVTIDPRTGQVTNIGALPNDTDALTFGAGNASKDMAASLMEWRVPVLVALFIFAVIVIIVAMRLSSNR